MSESNNEAMLSAFLAKPGPASAFALIAACRGYIVNVASRWHEANLSREDKIRELMSEMLLILLEDFSSTRAMHPRSVLAFIHLKLKRLTMPAMRKESAFGLSDDQAEVGRINFSPLRLELSEEIFQTVRRCLLGSQDEQLRQLVFLFVHVFPEVPWVSRLLAQKDGSTELTRIEADKKRLARFNNNLRSEFKNLQSGDYQEIATWSSGERSHLAWRIINISPIEVSVDAEFALTELAAWRERIDRRQPQSQNDLAAAMRVYDSMRSQFGISPAIFYAAEEAEPWGDAPEILLQLIGNPTDNYDLAEEASEWQQDDSVVDEEVADPEFLKIAEELSQWFGGLLNEKRKINEKTVRKVIKYT